MAVKPIANDAQSMRRNHQRKPPPKPDTMVGVFVSTRNLKTSCSNDQVSLASTASIESSSDSSSLSAPSSWKSSGSLDYHKGAPLLVTSPESGVTIEDEAEALGNVLARSRRLPGTWYFASNHIMVNKERTERMVAPLVRLKELDEIARDHAEDMASKRTLFHSDPHEIRAKFNRTSRRFGENVGRGVSIKAIHEAMMMIRSDRNNILDRRYTNFGMATARGSDGLLYMCQVFRG